MTRMTLNYKHWKTSHQNTYLYKILINRVRCGEKKKKKKIMEHLLLLYTSFVVQIFHASNNSRRNGATFSADRNGE